MPVWTEVTLKTKVALKTKEKEQGGEHRDMSLTSKVQQDLTLTESNAYISFLTTGGYLRVHLLFCLYHDHYFKHSYLERMFWQNRSGVLNKEPR